jgi:integrase
LRVPVPKDVQDAFGRAEYTESMREHDRTKAATKALPIISRLNAEWNALRAEAAARVTAATPTEYDLLALTWEMFERSQATLVEKRSAAHAKGDESYGAYRAKQEAEQGKLVRQIISNKTQRWEETAARVLRGRGYEVAPDSETFQRFVGMLAEATVSAIDVENRRDRGELSAKPQSEVVERAEHVAKGVVSDTADVPFSNVVDQFMRMWIAERATDKETNTEQQKRATFKLFGGFWGDKPIRSVTEQHAAEFYDAIKLLDPNWGRSPKARDLDWTELHAIYGNHESGLADSTMNRHLDTLQSLWDWARRRGHCGGENPFGGFYKKIRNGKNAQSYRAWENAELKCLFDPRPKRADLCEVMLVGMFTGMRLNEIAALTWGRLRTEGEGSNAITYFEIDDAKTPAGIRQVPVHAKLKWLLDRERGQADERIWPTFNPEGPGKKPGADASREFSRFKTERGFGGDRQKTFHSFRKNVTRLMERARVPENEWAQVFGHERGFTYAVYNPDGITLAQKADIISLIEYPGIDLPCVDP